MGSALPPLQPPGMPESFKLREDMAADRSQAMEDWLRVEGFTMRFRHKRWRVWMWDPLSGEGLCLDGYEEEADNQYRSGNRTNISIWDLIEKKFPGPGQERTRSTSPGEKKRTSGDRKRDKEWREYLESQAAEAAQAAESEAKGGTPAPSPQRAGGGHQPGHTTLGDFLEVAKKAKAKSRPLPLRKSGPSSDVESAHRGRRPADEASSSSGAAPNQGDVARAWERVCGVPCNLRVAQQQATKQNAALWGAICIAQQVAAEWEQGMAIHASALAAITDAVTAAAAREAAAARDRRKAEAAAREAAAAQDSQEAIARKGAEVKGLEEALTQERARKEVEEKAHAEALAHAEATAKAQADAVKRNAIEAARRKVAEEWIKTEAELKALEEEKARPLQVREAEAARAREEAERHAAEATATAMEEAEAKIKQETPPGGSEWTPFEGPSKGTPHPG